MWHGLVHHTGHVMVTATPIRNWLVEKSAAGAQLIGDMSGSLDTVIDMRGSMTHELGLFGFFPPSSKCHWNMKMKKKEVFISSQQGTKTDRIQLGAKTCKNCNDWCSKYRRVEQRQVWRAKLKSGLLTAPNTHTRVKIMTTEINKEAEVMFFLLLS